MYIICLFLLQPTLKEQYPDFTVKETEVQKDCNLPKDTEFAID